MTNKTNQKARAVCVFVEAQNRAQAISAALLRLVDLGAITEAEAEGIEYRATTEPLATARAALVAAERQERTK